MVLQKALKEHILSPGSKALKNLTARRSFLGVVFFLLTTLIIATNFVPQTLNFEAGDVSNMDIPANRDLTFESQVLTSEAREEAIRLVEPSFRVDKSIIEGLELEVEEYFQVLLQVVHMPDVTAEDQSDAVTVEEQIAQLESQLSLTLDPELAIQLVTLEEEVITSGSEQVREILHRNLVTGVQRDLLAAVNSQIMTEIGEQVEPDVLRQFSLAVVNQIEIVPTLVYDTVATQQKIEEIRNEVPPVQMTVRKDQNILRQGDVVTELHIEMFEQLGLQRSDSPYIALIGIVLLVAISFAVVILYLAQYNKEIFNNDSSLLLTGLLIVIALGMAKSVTLINFGGVSDLGIQVGHMIPLAAGSMLIAILLDVKLAIFLTVILGIFVGVLTGGQLQFVVTAVMGGLVGVYSVSSLNGRSDMVKAGLYVAGASMLSVIAMGLVYNNSLSVISVGIIMGLLNGILSSVFTIGLLPFLETAFNITTPVKLLELSNPNHPLLKRLLIEAPGTYHHSILAGNLAEAAADEVGADSLLVRVGAYYHDIGKLKRPYFFIENQLICDNPHDKLAPTLSNLIITSHVKDGVDLAKEHQLPQVIINIVEQHHGTSLMAFFYHKACEGEKGDTVKEEDFRYDGPTPTTKEGALVMLGDSVEAAVRSMKNPTPGRVEGLVRKIIKDKLNDGQLDHCDITLRDLEKITKAFLQVLNGIFHSRIEYPENLAKEIERRK